MILDTHTHTPNQKMCIQQGTIVKYKNSQYTYIFTKCLQHGVHIR